MIEELELDSEFYLDLRGIPCPINFVRCSLALETLSDTDFLKVFLDKGEPEEMVISGLREKGYKIETILDKEEWLGLLVIREKT